MTSLTDKLSLFAKEHKFNGKGTLCVALACTDHARKNKLPLNSDALLTKGRGQVKGLGLEPIQTILKRHGILKVLAKEGGRTSRNSIKHMEEYVDFLNGLAPAEFEINTIEEFWIQRVHNFFASSPFKLKINSSSSVQFVFEDLIKQAYSKQRSGGGTMYAGAMIQHLVGAMLTCVTSPDIKINIYAFSTADNPTGRPGDFFTGNSAIHVTTAPTEALINYCQENHESGMRPIIITVENKTSVARSLAENSKIDDKIDVFSVQQFLAVNVHQISMFSDKYKKEAILKIISAYNSIIEEFETDPSLKIEAPK